MLIIKEIFGCSKIKRKAATRKDPEKTRTQQFSEKIAELVIATFSLI